MKKITTLCAVHGAIKKRLKGSTSEIAAQVGISRSSFYHYIDQISNYGGEVSYSRTFRCFYYVTPFELKLEIEVDGMSQIFGGSSYSPPYKRGGDNLSYYTVLGNKLLD